MSDFVGRNGDRVAIGYRFGPQGLGLYQKALLFYENLLDVLTNPLHGVAVASLSRLRDDVVGLKRAWAKALSVLAFWGMPAFGLMAVTGQDVIVLLLGEKWSGAGLLLSILALRGIPNVVERSLGWLHVTAGRADRWARWGVIASCAQLGAIVIGLWFGLAGVVIASAICTAVLSIPAIAYAGRPLGIRFGDVVRAVGPQMVGALTAVGLCHAIGALSLAEAPRVVQDRLPGRLVRHQLLRSGGMAVWREDAGRCRDVAHRRRAVEASGHLAGVTETDSRSRSKRG